MTNNPITSYLVGFHLKGAGLRARAWVLPMVLYDQITHSQSSTVSWEHSLAMLPMPPEVHRNVLSHPSIETNCTVVKMYWLKVGTNIYGDYSEKMAQMNQEDGFMSWGRRGSLDGPNSLFGIVYHVIYHKAKSNSGPCEVFIMFHQQQTFWEGGGDQSGLGSGLSSQNMTSPGQDQESLSQLANQSAI
ncbi:hypothetical protein F5J12DRAFT_784477 [Pisolithus orientalis]|uniref:uncharacterized protein n=1 Tax=Pisolithus orientalis TaxID=936130 RepID=UPI0022247F6D|nr:uncharacterized protein F5J12DRAFT_784477 [Pisolithus orientalis]KAI6000167.1 hypothetical protein F5J12DRAFT_784477 [Pisolithus orientalis]